MGKLGWSYAGMGKQRVVLRWYGQAEGGPTLVWASIGWSYAGMGKLGWSYAGGYVLCVFTGPVSLHVFPCHITLLFNNMNMFCLLAAWDTPCNQND